MGEVVEVQLKPGMRLRSAVCATEVIVVRAPAEPVEVQCGGQPMVDPGETASGGSIDPARADGSLLGKRYVAGDLDLEVLCTKAGEGSLEAGGVLMTEKSAKPLPSSD